MTPLLVALGAAVGAPLRLLAGHWLDRGFPWGTLLANVVGSFLLGSFSALRLGDARARAARHRLLRRLHDVLRLRGPDARARARPAGTAYAVATAAAGARRLRAAATCSASA